MSRDKMRLHLLKVLKESFGLKVFATFTLLIFIISFSFTFFFIGYQRDYLRDTLIKKGKLLAEILAYNSRLGVFSENKEMLKIPVEGIFQQEGVLEVSVFNLEGKLLTKVERSETGLPKTSVKEDAATRHRIFEILMKSSSFYYLEDNSKAEFWSPVITSSRYSAEDASLSLEKDLSGRQERIIGFVAITVDKGMLKKQLHNLLFKSILIGIAFLVIGSYFIYLITKGVTRPLNRLTQGVKTLEKGGIVKEVHIETKDEIGRLARAFNDMSKSLSKRERELRESEESYRELANSITDVFFAMDANLKYTYWNKASEELTGIPAKDAIGKSLFEIFPDNPETRKTERAYRDVLKTQKSTTFINEYHLQKKSHFFDITAYPSRDGLSVFVRDITKQKEMELALWESEKRYRSLFEGVPVGLYRTSPAGKILDVNAALIDILGYPNRETILQASAIDSYVNPKDHELFRATVEKQGTIYGFETQLYRYDGTTVWVEINARAIKNADGSILHYEGSLADVTDRKQQEEALEREKEKFRILVEESPLAVSLIDEDGFYSYNNPKFIEMFGYTLAEIPSGRDWFRKAYPDKRYRNEVISTWIEDQKRSKPGEGIQRTFTVTCKDGSEKIVGFRTVTMETGNKIVIYENITEQVMAEQKLRKSEEQLRSLAAHLQSAREEERTSIAREIHDELGQALTGLKMDLSWIAKKIPEDQTQILDKLNAMKELTGTTLQTVQRISTELRPGLLDDLGLVAAIEWQTEEFQKRTGMHCTLAVDPEDIAVAERRSTGLFRIFQETLTNVARHAQATRVQVSLKEKQGVLKLRVRDNGKGITKEQISDPKSFGIIGIKERAHLWGGEVTIKGKPEKGTAVVVKMPIKE